MLINNVEAAVVEEVPAFRVKAATAAGRNA